ncbi:MAG: hypothetical protein QOG43_902 [Actinomycetota bacterium]|jgi:hypothetical protein|nr:hypothetical protein [Actinomycetota bacterium]
MNLRLYRLLLLAYPRSFRRRFGDDMAQIFADLESHTSRLRLWPRTIVDMAASVPRQRLESLMDRFSPGARAYVAFALAVISAVAVVLVGSAVPLALPIVAIAALALALRHRHQLGHLATTGSRWYLFLAAGAATLASIVVLAGVLPDYQGAVADALWYGALFLFLLGWLLIATGAVLAVATAWKRLTPTRHPA